jgi:small subunit ribosomal protein S8
LKNGSLANKESVKIKYHKFNVSILKVLYKEGFVASYKIVSNNKNQDILINLRYYFNSSSISNLKIISSPSKTTYLNVQEISKINSKKNIYFFSTSEGILTDLECKLRGIGGTLYFVC